MQNWNFLQEMSPLPVFSLNNIQQTDVLAGKFLHVGIVLIKVGKT